MTVTSPLDSVMRRCGATMAEHGGLLTATNFGSSASEVAVCLTTVGMGDHSDRATIELSGTPGSVLGALTALESRGEPVWWAENGPGHAFVRCERADAPACIKVMAAPGGHVEVLDRSADYAAVALVGPRAQELLETVDLPGEAFVIHEDEDRFEVLTPANAGPDLWEYLLEAGRPFQLACVGFDALDHLAASQGMTRRSGR